MVQYLIDYFYLGFIDNSICVDILRKFSQNHPNANYQKKIILYSPIELFQMEQEFF